jgi:ubiquinone/menaquinone biosynthesis C-methylase UbiE
MVLTTDYDKLCINLLANIVSKDAAKRYLRIKRIDLELSLIKYQDKILDVGCGFGLDSIIFSKMGCFSIGIDISREFLHMKKQAQNYNVEFIQASAFKLPFRDKVFDVTVSYSSIEHAKSNYLEWIKEMKRVTKVGGYITITTSNKLNLLMVLLAIIKRKIMQNYFEHFFSDQKNFNRCLK